MNKREWDSKLREIKREINTAKASLRKAKGPATTAAAQRALDGWNEKLQRHIAIQPVPSPTFKRGE